MDSEEGDRKLSPLVGRNVKLLNREAEEEGLDTGLPPSCGESFRCESGERRLLWGEVGERRLLWGEVGKVGGVTWLLTCLFFTTGEMAGCTVSFVPRVDGAPSQLSNKAGGGGLRGGATENSASGDGRRRREGLVCCVDAGWLDRSKSSKRATSHSMSRSTSAGGVIAGARRQLMVRQPDSMALQILQ